MSGHIAYVLGGGTLPSFGASGGVLGIMAYYALAFPKNRFRFGFFSYFRNHQGRFSIFHPATYLGFSLSAPEALVCFLVLQFLGAEFQLIGSNSGTNYLAHIGGGIAGRDHCACRA